MKKLIVRLVLVVVVLVILALVGVVMFLGPIVKAGVEKVGPRVAKVPVKLDSANISVFSGSGELKGFSLGNPQGYKNPEAIKVGSMSLSIAPGSLLSDKKHIRSIKVESPEINYEADLQGGNLGKILDSVNTTAEADKKTPSGGGSGGGSGGSGGGTKLQVDELVITGAKVHVGAAIVGATTVSIPDIRLEKLGEGPDGITPAELSQFVLKLIVAETSKAVAGSTGKLQEALKSGDTESIKKAATGIGDLFKKK